MPLGVADFMESLNRFDELGLSVVRQRLEPDQAVIDPALRCHFGCHNSFVCGNRIVDVGDRKRG